MIICIDAGHSFVTKGHRCPKDLDSSETREWLLNDRIARKVQSFLRKYDCTVIRGDDTTGKRDIPHRQRLIRAAKNGVDCYICIRHSYGCKDGGVGGVIVYSHTDASDNAFNLQNSIYTSIMSESNITSDRKNPTPKTNFHELVMAPKDSVICECGFMDSADNVPVILSAEYANIVAKSIAMSIVNVYDLKKRKDVKNVK